MEEKCNPAAWFYFWIYFPRYQRTHHNHRQRQKNTKNNTKKRPTEIIDRRKKYLWDNIKKNVELKLLMHKKNARTHSHSHRAKKETVDWNYTHTRSFTYSYMHREIKEVVRRCLLAWLIKNSVNEAALSPQIEQMDTRQQRRYPSPQTQAASRGEDVCVLVFTCVWERCFVNISFCIMNAVLCRPQSHTHSSSSKLLHQGASFTCQTDSPPLSQKQVPGCFCICVCVCV